MVERRREQQHQSVAAPNRGTRRPRPSPAPPAIGSAAPDSTLHDCAIESMRHSTLLAEPSGVPSSKNARRYQSPSQPCSSSAPRSCVHVRSPAVGSARVAPRFGDRDEPGERAVQEPPQPDALALALLADAVHPVVPVAGADQRQAVGADARGCSRSPPRSVRTAFRSRADARAGSRRRAARARSGGPSRYGTVSSSTAWSPVTAR